MKSYVVYLKIVLEAFDSIHACKMILLNKLDLINLILSVYMVDIYIYVYMMDIYEYMMDI